jgi:hypothetical protein
LITLGTIAKEKIEEIMKDMLDQGDDEENEDQNLGALTRTRNILDLLVREVTLCDSITSSEHCSMIPNVSGEEISSYISLQDLFMRDGEVEDALEQFKSIQPKGIPRSKTGGFKDKEGQQPDQEKREKRKYLRRHEHSMKGVKPRQGESTEPLDAKYSPSTLISCSCEVEVFQEHITTIQKNVRGWLLRRQYLDMKYATKVLQGCKNFCHST